MARTSSLNGPVIGTIGALSQEAQPSRPSRPKNESVAHNSPPTLVIILLMT